MKNVLNNYASILFADGTYKEIVQVVKGVHDMNF